ncbi:hypothetical protein BCR36DRAFT_580613 [Piromyces finnis]|uniref:Uncharacterized protein n=1 Tax=Piromyces finnis TaxID=1754191 RepID=A0A1Y1VIP8_9FUNG|nr:hypothetical protein BCR36DRAFT_580613 [Piromyces finnis]|eukprot:ORX57208.1 hypothetical protein BCR36DRAFT_580613 [Piromyces finnis]
MLIFIKKKIISFLISDEEQSQVGIEPIVPSTKILPSIALPEFIIIPEISVVPERPAPKFLSETLEAPIVQTIIFIKTTKTL